MKKPVMKALSITLCALLGLSGLGGAAYAMNAAGDPAPVEPAPVGDSGVAASSGETPARAAYRSGLWAASRMGLPKPEAPATRITWPASGGTTGS